MNTAILAAIVFVGLFVTWVILPSIIKKNHDAKAETEGAD